MRAPFAVAIVVLLAPTLAGAQVPVQPNPEQQRRHEQINLFEGTLERAVTNAARHVARDVQARTSNANFFSGEPRAKGFILDGYGVFVYVEIPALDLSLSIMIDQLDKQQQRGELGPVSNSPDAKPEPKTPEPKVRVPTTSMEALQGVMDTGEKYRNEVKLALTDAMLDFSKNLQLKPDEWLSVAARGSEGALTPGEIFQLNTVVLRVKGSDLADYLAGRLTQEEARAKVELRQF